MAESLEERIPNGSRLAVLSISTADTGMADFVIDELNYLLAGKFTVADRNNVNLIAAELGFKASGEVSDESAVAVAKMLGANTVVSGSITTTGSSRRLTVRALNAQTAAIIAMANTSF